MKPPVPSIPRRATRDFSFKGYAIPAGTLVSANPLFTHHMPEIWPDPETFDPLRFTDEAQRAAPLRLGAVRWRRAYVPRLHFAYMQAKCFARHFCRNLASRWSPLQPRNGRCGRSRSRRRCG